MLNHTDSTSPATATVARPTDPNGDPCAAKVTTTIAELRRALALVKRADGGKLAPATFTVADGAASIEVTTDRLRVRVTLDTDACEGTGSHHFAVSAFALALKGAKGRAEVTLPGVPAAFAYVASDFAPAFGAGNVTGIAPVPAPRVSWPMPEVRAAGWPAFTDVQRAAKSVLPAVSRDETRRILTFARLEPGKAGAPAELVGTDAYRLHAEALPALGEVFTEPANVPREALDIIAAIKVGKGEAWTTPLKTGEGGASRWHLPAGVMIESPGDRCDFPNYRQLFSEDYVGGVGVPVAAFGAAVAAHAAHKCNRTAFTFTADAVKLATDTGAGEAVSTVPVYGAGLPDGMTIGFNGSYLAGVLKGAALSAPNPDVLLNLISPTRPATVTTPTFRGLVMPVRLDV